MLCHYDVTIVPGTNNSITYIGRSIVLLNGIGGMSFEDTKKIIRGRLELNYNDVEIDITLKCLVREHQYFLIPIACDVDFRNIMKMFVQSRTNIMELHVSSRPKLSSSYNIKHGYIYMRALIFALSLKHLLHSVGVGTYRILEDRIVGIYDENRIKIVYYDQRRYNSSNPSDNEDEDVMSLVETLDGDDDDGDDDEASCSRIWS
jgi:hypothetical protein